jgi:hypothetical protein
LIKYDTKGPNIRRERMSITNKKKEKKKNSFRYFIYGIISYKKKKYFSKLIISDHLGRHIEHSSKRTDGACISRGNEKPRHTEVPNESEKQKKKKKKKSKARLSIHLKLLSIPTTTLTSTSIKIFAGYKSK